MKSVVLLVLALTLAAASEAAPAAPAKPRPTTTAPASTRDSTQSSGVVFPDTTVVARVAGRTIHVIDFRDRYFASAGDTRPRNDSAGRTEFLTRLVDSEVMGLTAREANKPLDFEDRLKLREHTNTVMENTLYLRHVLDQVKITEDDIRAVYPQYGYQQHLRSITFVDRPTAERVRLDLLRGRLAWREAVRRYSQEKGNGEGDLGWVKRAELRGELGLIAFRLQPGAISDVIMDVQGFRILQCLDRKAVAMPPPNFMHGLVLEDLRAAGRAPLVEKMYQDVRDMFGVVYDSVNVRWAADQFKQAYIAFNSKGESPGGVIPSFAPADTGRVLVRTKDRKITLGQFIYEYSFTPPMFRAQIMSLEPFVFALDGPALRAERIQYAYSVGIDKDPEAIALIERKREELLVDHLYQDSVMNRVTVTPDMRKSYYKSREKEFVSFPVVRYARFLTPSKEAMDALLARLKMGVKAETIKMEDSLRGDDSSCVIQEVTAQEAGEYQKILFEELKPGQATTYGPDRLGQYFVFQSLRYDPPRQMSFDEVRDIVDQSVQNIEEEKALNGFLERRRHHYRIESHPEIVAQMSCTDPKLDVMLGETSKAN